MLLLLLITLLMLIDVDGYTCLDIFLCVILARVLDV